jgi:hypothetical protein
MGFCIGIGLILAWMALYVVLVHWQAILWIIAGLAVLAVLMVSDDARQLAGNIFGIGILAFIGLWIWSILETYAPRWRWVQNLSAAYQKRTGGKV